MTTDAVVIFALRANKSEQKRTKETIRSVNVKICSLKRAVGEGGGYGIFDPTSR